MMSEDINPEVKEKVKVLEKKHVGFKVRKLRTIHGKINVEVS